MKGGIGGKNSCSQSTTSTIKLWISIMSVFKLYVLTTYRFNNRRSLYHAMWSASKL